MLSLSKALLIGINYKDSNNELNGCINDINNIKNILITKYGFKKDYILVLTDDTKIKPTRKNIIKSFRWLNSSNKTAQFNKKYKPIEIKSNKIKTNLVFCFSGHGGQVKDIDGDEIDGYDETLCPLDYKINGMISDDFIRSKFLNKIPPFVKLTAIVDACHSGTIFDIKWTIKTKPDSDCYILEKYNNYSKTKANIILLSSCTDDQLSVDLKNNGVLTYSLLKILEHYNYHISYEKLLSEIKNFIQNNKLSSQLPCLSFGRYVKLHSKFTF